MFANSDLTNYYLLKGGISISEDADLNNYKTPGNYYCNSNIIAKTLKNCPCKNAFVMKVEYGTGTNYPTQTIVQFNTGNKFFRLFQYDVDTWKNWTSYVITSDLGGAVFQPATGNIKYGMNGIYIGQFSNGPLQNDGEPFSVCVYLIGTGSFQTAVYAFAVTQYVEGHLFFNRMSTNNTWDMSTWKKLIS